MGSQNFMADFLAGWNNGLRTRAMKNAEEQEMYNRQQDELKRQQEMEDRALRMENFKIQKQELDLRMKQEKLAAAQQEKAMREQANALQSQLQPPSAAEVGIPEQGPEFGGPMASEIQVPQPMMPMPSPTGGADIQTPVLTGRQQQEMAARDWAQNLLKLRQKSEAERAPTVSEADKASAWKTQGDGTLINVFTGEVRGKPKPSGGDGGGGISPNQEAQLVDKLGKNWQAMSKDVRAMKRQVSIMDSGLEAARRGDLAAGSQAVLVTFQKVLDPTSVVRESEYARSAAGQSLLAQIEGAADRISKGGAGVPVAELEKFSKLAKEFVTKSEESLTGEKERIGRVADRYKIPRDLIFDEDVTGGGMAAPKATHRWTPNGGIVPIGGK